MKTISRTVIVNAKTKHDAKLLASEKLGVPPSCISATRMKSRRRRRSMARDDLPLPKGVKSWAKKWS